MWKKISFCIISIFMIFSQSSWAQEKSYPCVTDITIHFTSPKQSILTCNRDIMNSETLSKLPKAIGDWKGVDKKPPQPLSQIKVFREYKKKNRTIEVNISWSTTKDQVYAHKNCGFLSEVKVDHMGMRKITTTNGTITTGQMKYHKKKKKGVQCYFYIWRTKERVFEDGCTSIYITADNIKTNDEALSDIDDFVRSLWEGQ